MASDVNAAPSACMLQWIYVIISCFYGNTCLAQYLPGKICQSETGSWVFVYN